VTKRTPTGSYDPDLFTPVDLYLADARRALSDAQWDDAADHRVQSLQMCIDYACDMLENGQSLIPRF
jgi:hypothetical protein